MPPRSHNRFAPIFGCLILVTLLSASCRGNQNGDRAASILIDAQGATMPFDSRLLGANVPAWLTRSRLENEVFTRRVSHSGTTVLRMPGGSWSNGYDWLGCETGNQEQGSNECYWPWAARPTDFINLMRSTGQQGMWTVSLNGTAKGAAALVAFFNGDINDTRSIGVDRNGKDWRTVDYWARLRSKGGNPTPQKIQLWEVGNEIYGGKQGKSCSANGWEDVWTCDGTEYARGNGQHEGYLAFREEMRKVDSSILVGAVGVAKQSDWSNWGNNVIAAAGQQMDFYVIHQYAYSSSTTDYADVLRQPQSIWQALQAEVNRAFDTYAEGRRIPIAVTEYNLFAFQDLDNERLMTRAVNALFLADTIGQMAQHGVMMANQYDVANGAANNGTDYGLLNADSYARSPQYYVYPLWAHFGNQMLPITSTFDAATTLSVYAGRIDNSTLTFIAINKTNKPIAATIQINGVTTISAASADVVQAASLDATSVTFNGQADPPDDLANVPGTKLAHVANPLSYTFAPYSITLLRIRIS